MEVGDDISVLPFPRFVTDDFDVQDSVRDILPVRMFAVFDPAVVRTSHRAVPAGQHVAVPLEVIFGAGFPDMVPGIGVAQAVVVIMFRAPEIKLRDEAEVVVILHGIQISFREGDPDGAVCLRHGISTLIEDVLPMVIIPAACCQ